jgi:long-chain fatty acid transport protein
MKRLILIVFVCMFFMSTGDLYSLGRYRDIIIGNTPTGLGGAFIGVADDNNAVWYNPAGMTWIQGSSIGTSPAFEVHANGRLDSFLGSDEGESSILFVPTSLCSVSDALGGKLGLGVFMPIKSAFNQSTSAGPVTAGPDTWAGFLDRASNEEMFYLGASYGYRINDKVGIGGGLYYVSASFTHHLYQLIYDPAFSASVDYQETEIKETYKQQGFAAMVSAMFEPVKDFKIGVNFWSRTNLNGSGLYRQVDTEVNVLGFSTSRLIEFSTANDLRVIPANLGVGISWRINEKWMIAADLVNHFGTSYTRFGNDRVNIEPVINVSIGAEWMITPKVPFRFGIYTNDSFYPEIDSDADPNQPHVDVFGVTVGAGYNGEKNRFFGGLKIGSGTGKELVFDQVTDTLVEVDAVSYTVALFMGMNYNF